MTWLRRKWMPLTVLVAATAALVGSVIRVASGKVATEGNVSLAHGGTTQRPSPLKPA